ncbi:arsenical-resistance protein ACR3 [Fennellomyces sp. T-0311]|nr:arsenical-resistance protein ACR3 [Fennellomyces sp. T-0311]
MIVGVIIGYFVPSVQHAFETVQFGSVSVPIAIGLLIMMYPVLCDVQYERLHNILFSTQIWIQMAISLFINWIMGPIIMTALAWATLPDISEFRAGVIMVGLARCIGMVLIWIFIAEGDMTMQQYWWLFNSLMQIALYSPMAVLFINIIPSWFGAAPSTSVDVETWPVAQSVLIYLGIPLLAGIVTRFILMRFVGRLWYEDKFMPVLNHFALIGLIYTIAIMFANQGHQIIENIGSVFRVAVPLAVYFLVINNFELAIAVAVGTYGIQSEQVLSATVGALIEVPVLLTLTYVALYFRKKLNWDNLSVHMAIDINV